VEVMGVIIAVAMPLKTVFFIGVPPFCIGMLLFYHIPSKNGIGNIRGFSVRDAWCSPVISNAAFPWQYFLYRFHKFFVLRIADICTRAKYTKNANFPLFCCKPFIFLLLKF